MMFYTNSKEDLLLFDHHFFQSCDDHYHVALHYATVSWKRPAWSGVMSMMKRNNRVYLFNCEWYRVRYSDYKERFRFNLCDTPNFDEDYTCNKGRVNATKHTTSNVLNSFCYPFL